MYNMHREIVCINPYGLKTTEWGDCHLKLSSAPLSMLDRREEGFLPRPSRRFVLRPIFPEPLGADSADTGGSFASPDAVSASGGDDSAFMASCRKKLPLNRMPHCLTVDPVHLLSCSSQDAPMSFQYRLSHKST